VARSVSVAQIRTVPRAWHTRARMQQQHKKKNSKSKPVIPDPFCVLQKNGISDVFLIDSLRPIYYTLQGLFMQNKLVCEKTADLGLPLLFDNRGPVINVDVLVQTMLSSGFVFECAETIAQKYILMTFTDRSLNDVPREIAAVIRGPYTQLVGAISEFKHTVEKTVDTAGIDVETMPKTQDVNSIFEGLVTYCSIRVFFQLVEYERQPTHMVIKNYFFSIEKDLGTSFATRLPKNQEDRAIAIFK
jgi:hypothetical protein